MELKKGILIFAIMQTLVFTVFNVYNYIIEPNNVINSLFLGLSFAVLIALSLSYNHIKQLCNKEADGIYL